MAVAAAVAAPALRPRAWQTTLLAIPALATIACLAAALRFLIWTSGRGLDITDEGFYFLVTRNPGDVVMTTSAFGWLLSPLFRVVGWNIPAFRVMGFCVTVLSAFVLAAGLDALRRRLDPDGSRSWTYVAAEAAAIGTGSLLGYSWLLTAPSYNSITSWGLSISTAALLVALAHGGADRAATIWLGLLGASLGVVFLAKFTAAVSAGLVFAAVMFAWPLVALRVKARWLFASAAGFALALTLFFLLFQSPSAWLRAFRLGLWAATTQSPLHRAGAATRYYLEWRDDVVLAWLKDFGPVFSALTALAVAIRFVPARRRPGIVLRVLAWGGIGYAVYVSAMHVRDYPAVLYQYDVTRMFFGWLLLLGPLALAWPGPQQQGQGAGGRGPSLRLAWSLVAVMLLILPFCGAVGTGNPLQYGMRYELAPWFALLALILGRLSAPARTRWALPVGLAFLSATAIVYLFKGPLEAPYRLLTGIREQTEDTPIGSSGVTLKLDPVLHAFITDVRAAAFASGFRPGDDLLGLYDMPGIVYALGGRSPGMAWYTMGYPGSRSVAERGLALADRERLRRAFILQTASSTEWLQTLKPFGINFPDDYVLGGTFTIPYSWAREDVKWWRPRYR